MASKEISWAQWLNAISLPCKGNREGHVVLHSIPEVNLCDRRDARACLGIPQDLNHTSCNLSAFVFWLDIINSQNGRALIKQILSWLAMLLEYGPWQDYLMDDVLQVPVLEGPQRAIIISRRFKERVSRLASQGSGLTSGRHVLQLMDRFKLSQGIKSFKAANLWVHPTMARYYWACQQLFVTASPGFLGVISLAWDATRLSGMEMLFSTIYAYGTAFWCTPVATRGGANSVQNPNPKQCNK